MTVIQKLSVNAVTFTYSNGKASMTTGGTMTHDLSIEDVETIAEFLNGIVRNYHVRDYRFNEVVRE